MLKLTFANSWRIIKLPHISEMKERRKAPGHSYLPHLLSPSSTGDWRLLMISLPQEEIIGDFRVHVILHPTALPPTPPTPPNIQLPSPVQPAPIYPPQPCLPTPQPLSQVGPPPPSIVSLPPTLSPSSHTPCCCQKDPFEIHTLP